MTQTITETVRRTADITREAALRGLIAKFPDHDIVSLEEERIIRKRASGEDTEDREWVAQIRKKGFEDAAVAEPEAEVKPEPEAEEKKEESLPEDAGDDDALPEPKDEKEGGIDGKLDELIALIHELMGGGADEGAPHDEMGPTGHHGPPPGAGGPSDLPAPAKPGNGLESQLQGPRPAFGHMADKRHFFLEADAPGQSLREAVIEINRELPRTHRVAKIQRRGRKIIAGVKRV